MRAWLSRRDRRRVIGSGLLVGFVVAGVGSLGAPAQAVDSEWSNPTGINGVDDADALRSIKVSGVQGTTTDVSVTLVDVSHKFPDDMDIMLYSPGGHRVVLLSDSCGSSDIAVADITIDDEAAKSFPDDASCAQGSYRPADHNSGIDQWLLGDGPTASTMAGFDGIDPNGVWTLEVGDDSPGDGAKIVGGWTLNLVTTAPLTCNGLEVEVDLAKGEKPTSDFDVIRGTAGNDTINGLGGNDVICGLGGDDIVQGGAGDDVIIGGPGRDTASYASAFAPVTVTLATGDPQLTSGFTGTDALKQIENLYGGAGSDTLTGNALNNDLFGLKGDDGLNGVGGSDKLFGGPDTDTCNGGVDTDTAAACETTINVP